MSAAAGFLKVLTLVLTLLHVPFPRGRHNPASSKT